MGGFSDISGWDDLVKLTETVQNISSMSEIERDELQRKMSLAIQVEKDLAAKEQKILMFTRLIKTGMSAGVKAALSSLI